MRRGTLLEARGLGWEAASSVGAGGAGGGGFIGGGVGGLCHGGTLKR